MERRDFLKKTVFSAGALVMGELLPGQTKDEGGKGNPVLPRRKYKNDIELSMIGFGGIVLMGHPQAQCDKFVAEAVAAGVNYFDVAPQYGNGEAETKLGPALEPYRKDCFLACKTLERTAAGARQELKRSLARARTDHFDLYQMHALNTPQEVEQVLGKGGAMEAFVEAKKSGQVRHLGFSSHTEEAALALLEHFEFDSILFPFNAACWHKGNFGPGVMELAQKKGVARLALKGLCRQVWPKGAEAEHKQFPYAWYQPVTDPAEQKLSLRFTLSLPVTACVPPGNIEIFRAAVAIAREFKPLGDMEQQEVKTWAMGLEPIFKKKG